MKEKVKCQKCGKEVTAGRGYAGHLWLSHQVRVGLKWELEAKVDNLQKQLAKMKTDYAKLYAYAQSLSDDKGSLEGELSLRGKLVTVISEATWKDSPFCPKCGKLLSEHVRERKTTKQDGFIPDEITRWIVRCPGEKKA